MTSRRPSILTRSILLGIKALPLLLSDHYDLIYIGFYGHLLAIWSGLFSRKPLLFDAFISTYQTFCFDRQKFSPESLLGRLAYWLDVHACRVSSHVLLDTPEHIQYFVNTFGLPLTSLSAIPVGCNEDLFFPRDVGVKDKDRDKIVVLAYSTYLPLHGMDVVIDAARILSAEKGVKIEFRLIGNGPMFEQVRRKAALYDLSNVHMQSSIPIAQLPDEIAQADICLGGHFGCSPKADLVIPGKVYQILAMGKPLIASDTLANRRLLTNGKNALLCPPRDSLSLAQQIRTLATNPLLRKTLGVEGRSLYLEKCSEAIITDRLNEVLKKIRIG